MTNFERTLDIIRERITPRLRPEYRKIWVQGSTRPSLTILIFTIFDKDRYVMEFIDIKGFRNYRPDVEDIDSELELIGRQIESFRPILEKYVEYTPVIATDSVDEIKML